MIRNADSQVWSILCARVSSLLPSITHQTITSLSPFRWRRRRMKLSPGWEEEA